MQLTDEQRQLVTDNHNLIYWYLNLYKLEVSEYYDLLAIELCNTAMKWEEGRSTFSNYFKVRADGIMSKEYRKANALKRIQLTSMLPLHEEWAVTEGTDTSNTDMGDDMDVKALMDGEYGSILSLKAEGYSQSEIADILGTNQSRISKILKRIKRDFYKGGGQVDR